MFLRWHVVCGLRRIYCCPLASTVVRFRPVGLSTSRPLSSSWVLRKDAPQPQAPDTRPQLDLDVWKSVMRSQALQEEKPNLEGEEGEEEPSPELEGELSPLEASRRLVEMWRLAGKLVPEHITDEQLATLAELTTKSSKKKYLKFLSIKENHKKANKEKKEKRRSERMVAMQEKADQAQGECEGMDEEEGGEPKLRNSFLLQFWSRSLDRVLNWRAAQAMQFGQPLVYDMSYEQNMSRQEMENTASQILESEGWNRRAVDPFHLHFCNLQPNSAYHRELVKRYGQETWERLLITSTSQHQVDLFPHESLVYLTADSPNVLHRFDHSKVYVIGAMVDRSIQCGVSLANAKRLKVATARLPLDEYLHWDSGAKNLTLDQVIRILMTVKETNSWEKALEFVPKRKHVGFHQQRRENYAKSAPAARTTQRETETKSAPAARTTQRETESGRPGVSKQRPRNQRQEKPSLGVDHFFGQARLKTALKSKLEERGRVTGKKNWWEDD